MTFGFQKEAAYDELHNLCREKYGILSSVNTNLGLYLHRADFARNFTTFENFAASQKSKKKSLHLHLYVSISYSKLELTEGAERSQMMKVVLTKVTP